MSGEPEPAAEPMSGTPTHAGGVVYRRGAEAREYLVVSAKHATDEWVLPKGHVEPAEAPESSAVREVREETGVRARIVSRLRDLRLELPHERQRIRFYLMEAVLEGAAAENRQSFWLPYAEALDKLTFAESRNLIRDAEAALEGSEQAGEHS